MSDTTSEAHAVDASAIVVAHDGSECADRALDLALDLAKGLAAPLVIVRVWSVGDSPSGLLVRDGYVSSFEEIGATVAESLAKDTATARGRHPEVAIECKGIVGHPAETLIALSAHARMLVVGSRGRGALTSLMLGSVSDQCVRHALCPVLVVRDDRD